MNRHYFDHDGLRLSYFDASIDAPPIVALHAHMMEGATFAGLADAVAPQWRVIAPDQRGHGQSDHPPRDGGYTRDAYLGDIEALLSHLAIERAVLLGNSLGGVNAYQFAARRPERTAALIVEDIGAVVGDDLSFALSWRGTYPTREQMAERIPERLRPYFEPSIRESPDGWRLAADPDDMIVSQRELNGDHWADWLASDSPALLLRGRESRVTTGAMFEEMAARRPNTRLVTLPGSHVLHQDAPDSFVEVVRDFLAQL